MFLLFSNHLVVTIRKIYKDWGYYSYMIRLYHYTDVEMLGRILEDGALFSNLHLLARDVTNATGVNLRTALHDIKFRRITSIIDRTDEGSALETTEIREFDRKNAVYFARNLDSPSYEGPSSNAHQRGTMIVFGFEVPNDLRIGDLGTGLVTMEELGLGYWTELYAQTRAFPIATGLLGRIKNGKYTRILPVKQWTK